MFLITFSDGNGRAELEENKSNGILVCDDGDHLELIPTVMALFVQAIFISGKDLKKKNNQIFREGGWVSTGPVFRFFFLLFF